ncbi:hypothetical protein ABC502_09935 [Alkalimonas sp. NCh-2]|uniref:hypothetical protein n=1 Tax=Alkalimonas sp. NCh-2 TaxID=3144846 RepID=UPI0031F60BF6
MIAKTSAQSPHQYRSKVFVVTFALLAFANALSTTIGWFYSVDVKGWWPLSLGVGLLVSLVYAALLCLLKSLTFMRAVLISTALAVAHVVHAGLYYLYPPNWLAVNNAQAVLTSIQAVVFSDYTFYALYGLFLGLAVVLAHVSRSSHG